MLAEQGCCSFVGIIAEPINLDHLSLCFHRLAPFLFVKQFCSPLTSISLVVSWRNHSRTMHYLGERDECPLSGSTVATFG